MWEENQMKAELLFFASTRQTITLHRRSYSCQVGLKWITDTCNAPLKCLKSQSPNAVNRAAVTAADNVHVTLVSVGRMQAGLWAGQLAATELWRRCSCD